MMLVIDIGTTGLRAAVMRPDGSLDIVGHRRNQPDIPFPGLVEFDASVMAELALDAARAALDRAGNPTIDGVGIASQRASTVVWERSTGRPIGPALGWQDLRTVGECLTLKSEHGLALAPNQSATKLAWLLTNVAAGREQGELCFGTVDSWIAWTLSEGALHVTDHTNAAVTGLYSIDAADWHADVCALLGIDPVLLPTIVDSSGIVGDATALPGSPPIAALAGDQQASLVGQGCTRPGMAKITFGTGGMLDLCTGSQRPQAADRLRNGTFPIIAWTIDGNETWAVEAIMLSAGTNVEWLRDDLGLIETAAESHDVASSCDSSDGVVYVPALLGLGTPNWDYGARGTLLGLTRGTERSHVVRAVLEGIAHRGADMVEAAQADSGHEIPTLRVDGGMSRNPTFLQALANATGKTVEVSPVVEATTVGAGFLAGVATGRWSSLDDAATAWVPHSVVEPTGSLDRRMWARAIQRTTSWIPELSALDF